MAMLDDIFKNVAGGIVDFFKNNVSISTGGGGNTQSSSAVPAPTSTSTSTVDTSYGANAPSVSDPNAAVSAPTSSAPNVNVTSAWTGTDSIDSYEDFMRNQGSGYESIYNDQINFATEQNKETLAAIQEQSKAAKAEADKQKELLYGAAGTAKDNSYTYANAQLAADLGLSKTQFDTLMSAIESQKLSGQTLAQEQRDLLLSLSAEQQKAIYDYADQKYASDMEYAKNQFDSLVEAITKQKESGQQLAGEQRDLLLSLSEEQRNAIYQAAELQRQQAHTSADVERERAVVDARSSHEQNKASYGANAEAMGAMGLTGGGYSDYINAKAYAQQRAETQKANAEAASVKRDADFKESQAKIDADNAYYQNKYAAESQYGDRMYDIDTTYQKNMLEANRELLDNEKNAKDDRDYAKFEADSTKRESDTAANSQYADRMYDVDTTYEKNVADATVQKATMDHAANEKASGIKHEADQKYNENKYAADSTYSQAIADAEATERADTLSANQKAEEDKFNAGLTYRENMLENDRDIAAYRQKKEDEAKAKEESDATYARGVYAELLGGANAGTYTSDQLRQLAKEYGLSEEMTNSLISAADTYKKNSQSATNAEIQSNLGNDIGSIQSAIESGAITPEQGASQIATIQKNNYEGYIGDVSGGIADTGAIDRAFANGEISEEQYADLQTKWNASMDTSEKGFTELTKSQAKERLDEMFNNGWISEDNKKALEATFKAAYTPVTKRVLFNNDTSFLGLGSKDLAEEGNNFSVARGDTIYRIESGGVVDDKNIKEISADVKDGEVFGYREEIYIKKDGKVYKIQKRAGGGFSGHYSELYNIFFKK